MWETVFEESMLYTHENLIIHCPSEELAEALMEVLERNGVKWCGTSRQQKTPDGMSTKRIPAIGWSQKS